MAPGNSRQREDATKYLITQGSAALEAIKNANTADPEVKDRVARIHRSIIADELYAEPTNTIDCKNGKIRRLAIHPSKPYWFAITDHPSDTHILVGDVHEGTIRILSTLCDPNGARTLTFGKDGKIYTPNSNGTIGIYRLITD